MDDVLTLLKVTTEKDSRGVQHKQLSSREVFCNRRSISRNEFFEGGRNGLNPEYVFDVYAAEYDGETMCRYNGNTYAIYRTYLPDDTDYIELYAQREGGTNGIAESNH